MSLAELRPRLIGSFPGVQAYPRTKGFLRIPQEPVQEDETRNREAEENGRIVNRRDTPIRIVQLSDRGRSVEREEKKTRENGKYYSAKTDKM